MKFILSLLITVSFCINISAQEKLTNEAYTKRYNEIKENYLTRYDVEAVAASSRVLNDFLAKMNFKGDYAATMKEYGEPLKWVKANMEKTGFKNFEEAEKHWQAMIDMNMKEQIANKNFFKYLHDTATTDDIRISNDVLMEILTSHPKKFKSLTDTYAELLPSKK